MFASVPIRGKIQSAVRGGGSSFPKLNGFVSVCPAPEEVKAGGSAELEMADSIERERHTQRGRQEDPFKNVAMWEVQRN